MNSIYIPPELTLKKNKSSFQFNIKTENVPLSTLINNIPLDKLKNYYDLETSVFIKNCDKLNFDFYNKIEQINFIPNVYNNLFIILIKEICLLIEEIERLNLQLREKSFNFSKEEKLDKNYSPNKEKKVYPNKLNYIINVNTNNKLKIKSSQTLKTFKENVETNNFLHKKISDKNVNNNFSNNHLNLDLVNKGLEKCNKELENLKILENLILSNYHNNIITNNNKNNKFNKNLNSSLKNLPF